ncbi:MAG: XrtA/PEP-CTERM system exopolysaccharide export protein [Gammaproteobacteria bacterium]
MARILPFVIGTWLTGFFSLLLGCAAKSPAPGNESLSKSAYEYIVGPGDQLSIFVWQNPDISKDRVPVRPDGKVSMPLVEDLAASGKTPNQLAREIEGVLAEYIKDPLVTVTVVGFVGEASEQVRVVGEAAKPLALPYRTDMTLLDIMIAAGGLTEFAAGNRATLIRSSSNGQQRINVRLEDLMRDGDISANLNIMPGDVLLIPESWF